MKHIDKNSDIRFSLTLTDHAGNVINPADYPLRVVYFTRRYDRRTIDIAPGEAAAGVSFDGNKLKLAIDNPQLAPGEVLMEVAVTIPDATHPDTANTISSGVVHTNIHIDDDSIHEHVHHGCSGDVNVEVSFGDGDGGSVDIQPIPNTVIDAICV